MKTGIKYTLYILFAVNIVTCKTPYTPAPITAVNNYLVVEGLINIKDSTYINLSRAVSVSAKTTVKPELKATISIESNQGGSYPLKELGNGVYAAAPLNLSAANQYRLRIKATNGNTYLSDFVQAKITPPIDSVISQIKPDGIHIGVNTHDAQNNTRYYRWDYAETWEFYSFVESFYLYNGLTLIPRTAGQQIHHCWGNDINATILLAATDRLSQDILLNNPITFVESGSEKLELRYSILIKQYALTKDGYDYWTLLKKNTEQLGSIFDALPSASIGNLHNINNAAEPVIGFISAGTFAQTRIFIDHYGLPVSYFQDYINTTPFNKTVCGGALVDPVDYAEFYNLKHPYFTPINPTGGVPPICADCTLRGTTTQPSYW